MPIMPKSAPVLKSWEKLVAIDQEVNRRVAAGEDRWQAYADATLW